MEFVAFLAIGAVLLAFLRRFVYRKVSDGELPLWVAAITAGTVWASLPMLLVLIAGAELLPVVWVFSAGSFVAAAASVAIFSRVTARRSREDADRAH